MARAKALKGGGSSVRVGGEREETTKRERERDVPPTPPALDEMRQSSSTVGRNSQKQKKTKKAHEVTRPFRSSWFQMLRNQLCDVARSRAARVRKMALSTALMATRRCHQAQHGVSTSQ